MTDAAFNTAFGGLRLKGNIKDPDKTAAQIRVSGPYYYDQRVFTGYNVRANTGERPLRPRDRMTFKNREVAWLFENAIYLGNGQFYTSGLLPDTCFVGTEQEIINALNGGRLAGSTTSAYLDKSRIKDVTYPTGN